MPVPPGTDVDVVTEQETRTRTAEPPLFRVVFHNDHYTTMEFVVWVLVDVFHKTEAEATEIMLSVHRNGMGVAGIYTYEVAETRVKKVLELAREHEFPLQLSIEPES